MIRSYRSAMRYAEEMAHQQAMELERQGDKPIAIVPTVRVREDGSQEFIVPKKCECCGQPRGGR